MDSVLISVTIIDTAIVVSGTTLAAVQQNAGYQWLNCDSTLPIPGATGQTYNVINSGTYAVALQLNGCVDTSSCLLITSVGMLENASGGAYHIAPNPTTGFLTVYAPEAGDHRIELYSVTGSLVYTERFVSDRPTLFIGDLPAGVYWMRINGEIRAKVMKL